MAQIPMPPRTTVWDVAEPNVESPNGEWGEVNQSQSGLIDDSKRELFVGKRVGDMTLSLQTGTHPKTLTTPEAQNEPLALPLYLRQGGFFSTFPAHSHASRPSPHFRYAPFLFIPPLPFFSTSCFSPLSPQPKFPTLNVGHLPTKRHSLGLYEVSSLSSALIALADFSLKPTESLAPCLSFTRTQPDILLFCRSPLFGLSHDNDVPPPGSLSTVFEHCLVNLSSCSAKFRLWIHCVTNEEINRLTDRLTEDPVIDSIRRMPAFA
ncbi:hypothetical protein SODALDRAFT_363796 [Sodiomyces alkalinus F11]|uniref:Uncharacterized protein n=1 Tax=Sodiomyces alkalinus (strain CBS 110278 / VKM F-3762 / F11) TaxID=1314773 RepID=A0A3N2PL16_SODAK|nr:hypothetical protein SODALDRAFT_363796 [Sodiomyces alkalinus F11]ROT35104.1 hypothetical protein SODALDRAFT_363796 [Sodiomyces alkalinus F11]